MSREHFISNIFKRLIITGAFSGALAVFLNVIITATKLPQASQGYQEAMDIINSLPPAILIVMVVFVAPLLEELMFRGLMYWLPLFIVERVRGIRRPRTCVAVAVVSSVIFGVYHMNLVQFVYATLMGLAMCLVYEANLGLFWTVVFHMIANLTSLAMGFVPGIDTPAGSIIAGIVSFAVVIIAGRATLRNAKAMFRYYHDIPEE